MVYVSVPDCVAVLSVPVVLTTVKAICVVVPIVLVTVDVIVLASVSVDALLLDR